jgi:hypothetical protein
MSQRFWRQLAYAIFRLGRGPGEAPQHVRHTLQELIKSHGLTAAGSGLQSMLNAATAEGPREAAGS